MADKIGAGMAGPAVLMAAITRLVPAEKRGLATGIVNAGGSFGQFIMVPIAATLMISIGWVSAMQVLGLLVLLCLPAAFLLKGNSLQSASPGQKVVGTREAIRIALRTPSYLLLAPKTGPVVLVFAAVMGVTFLSTVPPTAGLVAKFFGPANMAMLFGIIMLAHQVGGFFGAWLGGRVFEATGSYDWVWYIDVVLAVGATLVHLPIRKARPVLVARPA